MGQNVPFQENMTSLVEKAYTTAIVAVVTFRFSLLMLNMIQALDGQVFGSQYHIPESL